MRYYNENPQVTFWKKKYETLNVLYDRVIPEIKDVIPIALKLVEKMERFNSLPWYKKMFYKFK